MPDTKYKVIAFYTHEIPADLKPRDPASRAAVARRLAGEMFGLQDADFDPAEPCQFGGADGKGYILCAQVTAEAAGRIQAQGHPDLKSVFDPLPPHKFHTGARLDKPKGPSF